MLHHPSTTHHKLGVGNQYNEDCCHVCCQILLAVWLFSSMRIVVLVKRVSEPMSKKLRSENTKLKANHALKHTSKPRTLKRNKRFLNKAGK